MTRNSDGSQSDTQTQIDASSDGDIVEIAAGSFSWSSSVTVSGKGITVEGAGGGFAKGESEDIHDLSGGSAASGATNFTVQSGLGFVPGEAITVRYVPRAASHYMTGTVTSYSGTSLVVNVTGTTGTGTGLAWWTFWQEGLTKITNNVTGAPLLAITEDASHPVRIQDLHCIKGTGNGNMITIDATTNGRPVVIANNRFDQNGGAVISSGSLRCVIANNGFTVQGGDWGGPNTTQAFRSPSASQASFGSLSTMGDADTTGELNGYIETNWFHGFHTECVDFDGGCRMVFRYNGLIASGVTSHGMDTGNYGNRHTEVYANSFFNKDVGVTYTAPLDYFIFWRGGTGVLTGNLLPNPSTGTYGGKTSVKIMVENLTRDSGPYPLWGNNIPGIQYPAPRQFGMGYVDGSGDTDGFGYLGDPEPFYSWDNTGDAGSPPDYEDPAILNYSEVSGGLDDISGYVQLTRDWINDEKPGYAPYTYPHPLLGEDEPEPDPNMDALTLNQTSNSSPVTELWYRGMAPNSARAAMIVQHSGDYPSQPVNDYSYGDTVVVFPGTLTLEQALANEP